MAFWSGETIASPQHAGVITPFDPNRIDCSAYTIRMGAEYFVTPDSNASDLSTHTKVRLDPIGQNGFGGTFQIPPGQFAFLLTEEYLHIPKNVIAFVSLKTHPKWRGLVNVSGFHVDGGFEGHFIFAVYNAGPRAIHMQRGQDLFLIWFSDLDNKNTVYFRKGKPPQRDIDPLLVTDIASPILSAQRLSDKIVELEAKVQGLQTKIERITLWASFFGFLAGGAIVLIQHWSATIDYIGKLFSPTK